MMRDLDAEYDELVDELEEAVDENDSAKRGERLRVLRLRVEDIIREQMGYSPRPQPSHRRTGPNALH